VGLYGVRFSSGLRVAVVEQESKPEAPKRTEGAECPTPFPVGALARFFPSL